LPRVLPEGLLYVERRDALHLRGPEALIETAAREAPREAAAGRPRVDHHQVVAEAFVVAHRALVHRRSEAELHRDEDHSKRHAGQRHDEPRLFLHELQPRERNAPPHGSITTSTRALVSAATRSA